MSYCMVIDLKKCVGCNACTNACKQENGTPPGVTRCKVMKKEEGKYPDTRRRSIPLLCMHCEDPACVNVCPTGATTRDEATGIVSADKDLCVGCKACATACPYGARYFRANAKGYFGELLTPFEAIKYVDMPVGVVDKCDFCKSRLDQGLEPACVETCVTQCRTFGKKEDLQELILRRNGEQLKPGLATNPSVYYLT